MPTPERYNTRATPEVLREVDDERHMQDRLWGAQNHKPERWLAILTEEVGEVAKEIADAPREAGLRVAYYRNELVQVAAVAVAAIESLDRGNA